MTGGNDKWRAWGYSVLSVTIFGLIVFLCVRNSSYTCDTFAKYVLQCNGKTPNTFLFEFDPPKIREDFIKELDLWIVTAGARDLFNFEYDPKVGDIGIDELRRLKMLGAWREGNRLIISNCALTSGDVDDPKSFAGYVKEVRDYTDQDKQIERTELQKGIFATMTLMFDSVEIRGTTKDVPVTITMPFGLRADFEK